MIAPSDRPMSQQGLPLSRPFKVDDVPPDGLETTIEADPAECAAIARQLDLPQVVSLLARFRVAPLSGGRLHVDGDLTARIVEVCVVSLAPFESDVAQPIALTFAPAAPPAAETSRAADRRERNRRRGPVEAPTSPPPVHGAGDEDPPDPIVDGRIDLGAVAVEFLALSLDFYPKKPGVAFADVVIGETDQREPSAFAVLERLKDRS